MGSNDTSSPNAADRPLTLPEKIWNRHVVHEAPGDADLLYIDLHLVHEVTSPQAFDGLRTAGRPDDRLAGWAACEFSAMQKLRQYLRNELRLDRQSLYISSYWKAGLVEDQHKLVKREDAEAQAA